MLEKSVREPVERCKSHTYKVHTRKPVVYLCSCNKKGSPLREQDLQWQLIYPIKWKPGVANLPNTQIFLVAHLLLPTSSTPLPSRMGNQQPTRVWTCGFKLKETDGASTKATGAIHWHVVLHWMTSSAGHRKKIPFFSRWTRRTTHGYRNQRVSACCSKGPVSIQSNLEHHEPVHNKGLLCWFMTCWSNEFQVVVSRFAGGCKSCTPRIRLHLQHAAALRPAPVLMLFGQLVNVPHACENCINLVAYWKNNK